MADAETKTKGAIKGGNGKFIFQMMEMDKIEAGTGYSTAMGPVIEGERMQCTLVTKEKGTGYIVKGQMRVKVGDGPEQICGPGTLLYFPANIVHYTIAMPEEDAMFFAVKDLSHGIIGKAADGTMAGGYYDPGLGPKTA